MDLKKAFDTVDHGILLKKLEHYGFRNIENIWFKNYLGDRFQYVSIDGIDSSLRIMTCGVPQGSVLGPLLFLIFINDLPNATSLFTLLFADDTTFQLSSNNLQELFTTANTELQKACEWFQSNKLTLNVSKTKYILFRSKTMAVDFSMLKLKIGDENIERIGSTCDTKYFKFVGLRLEEYLTWEYQINHVHGKISNGNFAISSVKIFLPLNVRLTLYNTLCRSHMEFGIIAWGGVNLSKLKKITQLQKKCVRNVAGKGYNSHTDPFFSKLNILKFEDLFKYNSCRFMHKCINEKLPPSFKDFFTPLSVPNRTHSFQQDKKVDSLVKFPSYFLPTLWNSNSLFLKCTVSHSVFKKEMNKSLIAQYSQHVRCNYDGCVDCFIRQLVDPLLQEDEG